MNIYHHLNLQESIDGMKKIFSISWSLNLMRLAIAHVDDKRSVRVTLFDENGEKKDSFPTKPANKHNKSYVVRDIGFSPCSTKLAVSQSDSIVFVYLLGSSWDSKKTICNKFEQTSQVSCMIWPTTSLNELYFGVAEGKVKAGNCKTNIAQVLYSTESYIVSLDSSLCGKYLLSGHIDNSIYKYSHEQSTLIKLLQNSCVPYCVAFGQDILVAGNNGKISFYNHQTGEKKFEYDYEDEDTKDFTCCKFNSSGDAVIVGSFNRFIVFYKKRDNWVEVFNSYIENLYTVTACCWKPDSSAIVIGNLCGSIDIFESCLKKTTYKNKEISFISESQIMIKDLVSTKRVNLSLTISTDVEKISIQKENYVIITTKKTLLIGNIRTGLFSELHWELSGEERFEFDINFDSTFCLIFTTNEFSVIQFGENYVLGIFKSSLLHPDLITCSIGKEKKIAYLVDNNTINIVNITKNTSITFPTDKELIKIEFDSKEDKMIIKDIENSLYLLYLKNLKKKLVVEKCVFFKLLKFNILIATNTINCFIWYNTDDITSVKRVQLELGGRLEIKEDNEINLFEIKDENEKFLCKLDTELIEIYRQLEQGNLKKAISFLELKELTSNKFGKTNTFKDEKELNSSKAFINNINKKEDFSSLWIYLAKLALNTNQLHLAQTCYGYLGQISKVKYIEGIINESQLNGSNHPLVEAKLLLLEKEYIKAENTLLKLNLTREAYELFFEIKRYDQAFDIAERYKFSDLNEITEVYLKILTNNKEWSIKGKVLFKRGLYNEALKLLFEKECYQKLIDLLIFYKDNKELKEFLTSYDINKIEIDNHLKNNKLYGYLAKWNELKFIFKKENTLDRAIEFYLKDNNFSKAKELSMKTNTNQTSYVENQWGNYLFNNQEYQLAFNHFLEGGDYLKAIQCCFKLKNINKIFELTETYFKLTANDNEVNEILINIGSYFENKRMLNKAEILYTLAFKYKRVIEMYCSLDKFNELNKYYSKLNKQDIYNKEIKGLLESNGFKIASSQVFNYVKSPDTNELFNKAIVIMANECTEKRKYVKAEKLYMILGDVDSAIEMYKNIGLYEKMIELIKEHRPLFLNDSYLMIADIEFSKIEKGLSEGNKTSPSISFCIDYFLKGKDYFKAIEVSYFYENNTSKTMNLIYNYLKTDDFLKDEKQNTIIVVDLLLKIAEKNEELIITWLKEKEFYFILISLLCELGLFEKAIIEAESCKLLEYANTKYAQYYRSLNKLDKAEEFYTKASNYKDLYDMYIEKELFSDALRIAQCFLDNKYVLLVKVTEGYYFARREMYDTAEKSFLEAKQPEKMVETYLKRKLFDRAKVFIKKYLPDKDISSFGNYSYDIPERDGFTTTGGLEINSSQVSDNEISVGKPSCNNKNYTLKNSKFGIETMRNTKVSQNSNIDFLVKKFDKMIQENCFIDAIEYLLVIQQLKQSKKIQNDKKSNKLIHITSEETLELALELVNKNLIDSKEKEFLIDEIASRYLNIKNYKKASEVYCKLNNINYFEKAIHCLMKGGMINEANELINNLEKMIKNKEIYKRFAKKMKLIINSSKYNAIDLNEINNLIKQKEYYQVMKMIKNFSTSQDVYDNYLLKICSILFNDKELYYLCEFLLSIDLHFNTKLVDAIKSVVFEVLAEENLEELEVVKFIFTKYRNQIYEYSSEENKKELIRLEEISHFQYFKCLCSFHSKNANLAKHLEQINHKLSITLLRYGDVIKFDLALYDAFKQEINKSNKNTFIYGSKFVEYCLFIKGDLQSVSFSKAFSETQICNNSEVAYTSKDPIVNEKEFVNIQIKVEKIREKEAKLEYPFVKCNKCNIDNLIINSECFKCLNKFDFCWLTGNIILDDTYCCQICKTKFENNMIDSFLQVFDYCPFCLNQIIY